MEAAIPRSNPGGANNFYSPGGANNFYSPVTPTNSAARNDCFQNTPEDSFHTGTLLHRKIDQLLTMITSSQQVLVDQQACSERLENKVEKLSDDVFQLTSEIDEMRNSTSDTNGRTSRVKIPSELLVRLHLD